MSRALQDNGIPRWLWALAAVALIKVVVATISMVEVLVTGNAETSPFQWLLLFVSLVFTACGAFLTWSGRSDARAGALGTFYLVSGAVFADGRLLLIIGADASLASAARVLLPLQVDAFTPYLLWLFVTDFPRVRVLTRTDQLLGATRTASLIVGVFLFVVNVVLTIGPAATAMPWLAIFSRRDSFGYYWLAQYPLMIGAFLMLLWRIRLAHSDERRRAVLLATGLSAGTAPMALYVMLLVYEPSWYPLTPLRILIYPAILAVPITSAYAVIVERALDVKLVIRLALQYAFARYSVLALTATPLGILIFEGYRNRSASLESLLGTQQGALLLGASGVGVVSLVTRDSLLRRIDRRFFREQHDAQQILSRLVEQCRRAADVESLCRLLHQEIERALHADAIHVLLKRPDGSLSAVRGEIRMLDRVSSVLPELIEGRIVDVDLERARIGRQSMSAPDLDWASDANARLLLPLRDASAQLIGVIALGEKRSELPYSAEDRRLLSLVAAAAEMAIGYRQLLPVGATEATSSVAADAAVECTRCGLVQVSGGTCSACMAATVPGLLPLLVGGRLAVEQRIGAGGMGVVYRARDTHLDRSVAIKTLPIVSASAAVRLRREARFVAAVSHPNLALIYGAETWRGRPMLVFEHLAGGTLADRIAAGPLPAPECIRIGIALASAIGAIHRAGLLHRDVKPSNIGFAGNDDVKLLDFGLARVLTTLADAAPSDRDTLDPGRAMTTDSLLQGTPLYMSPEALFGAAPEPAHDLWALCMVLYEAAAGAHPWRHADTPGHVTRIALPDVRTHAPATPEPFADLLSSGLSPNPANRPQSAHVIERALRASP